MAVRSRASETRTAEGGPAPTARAQPCLARIFICDRPLARAARYPLGGVHRVAIGRGADGVTFAGEGRDRQLELRCADTWMSRAHATLTRVGRGWRAEDAGSKNGTLLDGHALTRATLADGDILEIGQTLFLYRDAVEGLGAAPSERDRPLAPSFDDVEDLGLAVAAALTRLGQPAVRFLPAAARVLASAWPVDLERCLRSALAAAAGAPIGPEHLPSPLPRAAAQDRPTFTLAGDLVAIRFGAASLALKDSDGLRYLAHLIERPDVEVHALDLVAVARAGRGSPGAAHLGDAGPLLDPAAKAAYQRRLAALRAAAEEAAGFGDQRRAERARAEIEALATELARAVGLGGRDRKASSAVERARVNVTLRIRAAMKRIAAACPPLGQHLEASLHTGAFCCYQPIALAPPARDPAVAPRKVPRV